MSSRTSESQPDREPLTLDFPPLTPQAWRERAEADLNGAPFEKKLVTRTDEGLDLQPIYWPEDTANIPWLDSVPGAAPFVRGGRAEGCLKQAWEISQEIAELSPADFNRAAMWGLERGLTAVNMVLDEATRNGHDPDWEPSVDGTVGLSVATLDDLDRALQGIDLARVALFVRSGASALPMAALLAALARRRGLELTSLRGCIEMDPLGVWSHTGRLPQSLDGAFREMAALARWASTEAPHMQTVCVHARVWHEGGGHAAQELGWALAAGAEYLRALLDRGLAIDTAAPRFRFAFTVGSQWLMEVAKLRAARVLWSQIVEAFGGIETSQRMALHVRTATANKSRLDLHTNLIRTSVEASAAVLGGCDSLQVGAFDEVAGVASAVARRIARNTQIILQKECQWEQVIDPLGGAWAVESMTLQVAQRAWDIFRECESQGGLAQALRSGSIQQQIRPIRDKRAELYAQRRRVLVGVNQYANPAERSAASGAGPDVAAAARQRRVEQVRDHRLTLEAGQDTRILSLLSGIVAAEDEAVLGLCIDAVGHGATLGEITRAIRIHDRPEPAIEPIPLVRWAEPFESLRSAVAAATGPQTRVFLSTMGPLSQHKARADFSQAFLQVAGFEIVTPDRRLDDPEAAAAAFAQSDAATAVLCSTDDSYPALVEPWVRAMRQQRPNAVLILAGYPEGQIEAHRAAGIDVFIHLKANALETLRDVASRLGLLHGTAP